MTVGAQDLDATANALRVMYSEDELRFILSKRNAFFNDITKTDDFEGESFVHVVQHGYNQGVGATMAAAEASMSTDLDAKFNVPRRRFYAAGKIAREVILATRSKKGAAVQQLKRSYDSCLLNMRRLLQFLVWGDGGGAYAVIDKAGVADGLLATQIQIKNARGMHWLEKDMQVHYSADRGGTGLTTVLQDGGAEGAASTGLTNTIAAVNRKTGLITMSANIDTDVDAGHYLFRKDTKGLMPHGSRTWCPQDDTTAALDLFGQVRSSDIVRLSGLRWLDVLSTYQETLREAISYAEIEGGEFTTIYMNPVDIGRIDQCERDKVVHDEKRGELEIGFDVIKFRTPIGVLDMMADSACPQGWAKVTNPAMWRFKHLGKLFGFFEEAGLLYVIPAFDGYGFRGGGYGNLVCDDPKSMMWVKLSSNAAVL